MQQERPNALARKGAFLVRQTSENNVIGQTNLPPRFFPFARRGSLFFNFSRQSFCRGETSKSPDVSDYSHDGATRFANFHHSGIVRG